MTEDIGKHLPGRHNQLSHGERFFQGLMRGPDAPKGDDHVEVQAPRERAPRPRERVIHPNDPLTKPPMAYSALRERITAMKVGTPVTIVARKKRGQQWVRVEVEVAYLGWADQDHIRVARLPFRAGDPVQKAPFRSVRLGIQKWYVPNGHLTDADDIEKARKAVDGDGDGWVYDATPKKRPATPAERAAGAALRAKKGAAKKAPAKKAPAKKAAASPKAQRIARFERAIKAVKTKQDQKRVQALIDQDFILDKNDRAALTQRLNEHMGGKPAAAKKPPAKQAAPKFDPKAAKRVAGDRTGLHMPDRAMEAGKKHHADIKAAKSDDELDAIAGDVAEDPALREVHRRKLREDIKARRAELKNGGKRDIDQVAQDRKDKAKDPRRAGAATVKPGKIREAAAETPEINLPPHKGTQTRERDAAVDAAAKLIDKINGAQSLEELEAVKNGIMSPTKAILRKHPDLMKHANDVFKGKKQNLKDFGAGGKTTPHGKKTNAWKRLWNRDLGNAKTLRQLDRLDAQIKSLHRQGRISDNEAKDLHDAVERKRASVGGKHKRPTGLSARLSSAKAPGKKATTFGNLPDGPETKAYEGIAAAKDPAEVDRAVIGARDAMKNGDLDRAKYQQILNEGAAQKRRLVAAMPKNMPKKKAAAPQKAGPRGGTVKPASSPGKGHADAKKHRDKFRDKLSNATDLSAVEALMEDLEAIPPDQIDKDEFNEIAEMLNQKVERLEIQQQEPILQTEGIKLVNGGPGNPEKPDMADRDIPNRDHYENFDAAEAEKLPGGKLLHQGKTIEEAEKINPDGIGEYVHSHPDRFTVDPASGGASGYAFSVLDKQNGKMYFFKTASNDGKVGMVGDGINEYMAGALGNGVFGFIPNVEMAGRPENDQNHLIRMDHMDEIAKAMGGGRVHYDGRGAVGANIKDPRNPLAVHIFDYLINQNDRHGGNFGIIDDPNGKGQIIIPLDNGAAFHGYDKWVADQVDGMMTFPGKFLVEPENVSYNEWANFYGRHQPHRVGGWLDKATPMIGLVRGAYREKKWGRDKLAKDAQDIIDEFRKVDPDAIVADLRKRFPKMSEYEQQHLIAAAEIFKRRLAALDAHDIVRMLKI